MLRNSNACLIQALPPVTMVCIQTSKLAPSSISLEQLVMATDDARPQLQIVNMAADKWDDSIFGLAYKGDYQCLKLRVEEKNHLITELDDNKRMPIHWAALAGRDEILLYLLEHKSPVDPLDDMGMTPLILSSSAGKVKVVHMLISAGANVNAKNSEGHSALQYAASKGWTEVVTMLLDNQADINVYDKRGATPLHRAASKGNTEVVKLLLLRSNELKVDAQDIAGNTALHLSCEENRTEEAKMLVMHGASYKTANKEEKTPLDVANGKLAKLLVTLTEQ